MTRRTLVAVWSVVVGLPAVAACDVDDRAPAVEPDTRTLEDNGFRLNGFRLNSFRLNGFRLNGFRLNGDGPTDWIELQQLTVPGQAEVVDSWLVGSNLHAKTKFGSVLAGAQLVGAEFHFGVQQGQQGKKTKVRVTSVKPLKGGSDVLLYSLEIKDGLSSWEPLCVDDHDQATPAILLGDAWRPETGDRVIPRPSGVVTFACRDAALGKCVEWGYAPWRTVDNVLLDDHHQTCTRASRADYCGDGTSHTENGTSIHVLDKLGIQGIELGVKFLVEAEWGPGGALCLNPDNTRIPGADYACAPAECGFWFNAAALIQTGIPLL